MWQIIKNQKKKRKKKKHKSNEKTSLQERQSTCKPIIWFIWRVILLPLFEMVYYTQLTRECDYYNISHRVSCSPWTSPQHLAIVEAFAKENLYFLQCVPANYCREEIVLTIFLLIFREIIAKSKNFKKIFIFIPFLNELLFLAHLF